MTLQSRTDSFYVSGSDMTGGEGKEDGEVVCRGLENPRGTRFLYLGSAHKLLTGSQHTKARNLFQEPTLFCIVTRLVVSLSHKSRQARKRQNVNRKTRQDTRSLVVSEGEKEEMATPRKKNTMEAFKVTIKDSLKGKQVSQSASAYTLVPIWAVLVINITISFPQVGMACHIPHPI